MCGITGWVDWDIDLQRERPILEAMTDRLAARGPDASGYWMSERAIIGHRRLIVVDPAGGGQPMARRHRGDFYVLTYNGELYNTAELRRSLEERGHRFESYSDTEVVLVSYIEWGSECLTKFNGIFAFGIWSTTDQTLFLARDRLGVKPLFYALRGNGIIFGSELKALFAHPAVEPELDEEGLAEIFGLGPARTPGNGVFKGISELRPGQMLFFSRRGLNLQRYWSLQSTGHRDDPGTTAQRIRELLSDAITRQLVSDVPVCTLLSGGLDSSIITAVAAEAYRTGGKERLRTYSVDYVDNEKYFRSSLFQPDADGPWINQVASFLGTEHHSILLDSEILTEALRPALLARDLPGMADVDSSLYLFCRAIKQNVTVALSGECADEIFGGYPWFRDPESLVAGTFPWSRSLTLRNALLSPELRKKLRLHDYVAARYRDSIAEVPGLAGEAPLDAKRRELFYLNLIWFMAVLLERKDRMSMASGLEVRVPFCDHRLVEYVWNIPWEMKFYNHREKGILRRAVRGMLPDEVTLRKKSPYPKTHHPGYLAVLKAELERVMTDPAAPLRELVDYQAIRRMLQGAKDWLGDPWFGQLMTGPQLLAYLLQVNIWLTEYRIRIRL